MVVALSQSRLLYPFVGRQISQSLSVQHSLAYITSTIPEKDRKLLVAGEGDTV